MKLNSSIIHQYKDVLHMIPQMRWSNICHKDMQQRQNILQINNDLILT